jgi:hypothetical protein
MKRTVLVIGCIGLLVIVALQLISCAPAQEVHAVEQPAVASTAVAQPIDEPQATCAAPVTIVLQQQCAAIDQQVLASTVRLAIRVYAFRQDGGLGEQVESSIGHATVKDGRYLVTHNHYGVSLSDELPGTTTRLSAFKANGEVIVLDAPLTAFQVALEDPQTLVLDFGEYGGQGLFGMLGMGSAAFRHQQEVTLQAGMEVAQLDWDGRSAHVDWVMIEELLVKDGTPSLRLTNFVTGGSSGGPVFWNGYHIANNWSHAAVLNGDNVVTDQYSFAALNSPQVAAYSNS